MQSAGSAQRATSLCKAGQQGLNVCRVDTSWHKSPDDTLRGRGLDVEPKQRFGEGDVDVHGSRTMMIEREESLVHQSVAVPSLRLISSFGQRNGFFHQ